MQRACGSLPLVQPMPRKYHFQPRHASKEIRVNCTANGQRLKTVELVVESVPWKPRARTPRRRDQDIVAVRIDYRETDLRERAKRLGAVWRPAQKVWEISWGDARRLGIGDRVVPG